MPYPITAQRTIRIGDAQPAQPPVLAIGMPHQFQPPDLLVFHLQIFDGNLHRRQIVWRHLGRLGGLSGNGCRLIVSAPEQVLQPCRQFTLTVRLPLHFTVQRTAGQLRKQPIAAPAGIDTQVVDMHSKSVNLANNKVRASDRQAAFHAAGSAEQIAPTLQRQLRQRAGQPHAVFFRPFTLIAEIAVSAEINDAALDGHRTVFITPRQSRAEQIAQLHGNDILPVVNIPFDATRDRPIRQAQDRLFFQPQLHRFISVLGKRLRQIGAKSLQVGIDG